MLPRLDVLLALGITSMAAVFNHLGHLVGKQLFRRCHNADTLGFVPAPHRLPAISVAALQNVLSLPYMGCRFLCCRRCQSCLQRWPGQRPGRRVRAANCRRHVLWDELAVLTAS